MVSRFISCIALTLVAFLAAAPAISAENGSSIRSQCSKSESKAQTDECIIQSNKKSFSDLQFLQSTVAKNIDKWIYSPAYKTSTKTQFESSMALFAEFRRKQCTAIGATATGPAESYRDILEQSCEAYLNNSMAGELKRFEYGSLLKRHAESVNTLSKDGLLTSPNFGPCPDKMRMAASPRLESMNNCAVRLQADAINKNINAKSRLAKNIIKWNEDQVTRNSLSESLSGAEKSFYEFREPFIKLTNIFIADFDASARNVSEKLSRTRWYSIYTSQLNDVADGLAKPTKAQHSDSSL